MKKKKKNLIHHQTSVFPVRVSGGELAESIYQGQNCNYTLVKTLMAKRCKRNTLAISSGNCSDVN